MLLCNLCATELTSILPLKQSNCAYSWMFFTQGVKKQPRKPPQNLTLRTKKEIKN